VIPGLIEVLPLVAEDLHLQAEVAAEVQGKMIALAGLITKAVMPKDQPVVHSTKAVITKGQPVALMKEAVMTKDQLVAHLIKAEKAKDQHAVHLIKVMMAKGQHVAHSTEAGIVKDQLVRLMNDPRIVKAATIVNLPKKIIPEANQALQVLTEASASTNSFQTQAFAHVAKQMN